jgi:phospholipid/cholesterol/gamma-HCH transport system ATP-binding protein
MQAVSQDSREGTETELLREGLEASLRLALSDVNRLGYACTSVDFRVAGQAQGVGLLLDRTPPELADPAGSEIVIELPPTHVREFVMGGLAMPAAVLAGRVVTDGPIRKYLEVDPILRKLLAQANLARLAATPGPDIHPALARAPAARASELLAIETQDLHKSFGSNQVLKGASIAIPAGMISCVVGPSGTGKSVLLKHIIGLLRPDGGEILIRGCPLGRMRRDELIALRQEIGVMFQDGALFSTMTVYDNVAFPLRQHTDLEEHEIREVVEERLDTVGLLESARRLPAQLSGGMKKRAGLARALVLDPGIVLCDEPDSGLDPVRTALLAELLVEQHSRNGGTMLVITHNVPLARQISDHISVLWQGKVLEAGLAETIFTSDTPFVKQFLDGEIVGPLGMD